MASRRRRGDLVPRERKTCRTFDGRTFQAVDVFEGILVDPLLPPRFDDTPNEERPRSHDRWWERPFISTMTTEDWEAHALGRTDEYAAKALADWRAEGRAKWLVAWPSGTRFDVRCLDGGAWDRSTYWGAFGTLVEALRCAQSGSSWQSAKRVEGLAK